ncbi:hypothetical protein [Limnohabitans sp.]|uniref:hypothetical protein n=1 Tax=Limnohabitans sp. TaxID=1907725 RepID=UPI0039BCF28A|nr:hypothetical protein [Comamonadaceae bacterium]
MLKFIAIGASVGALAMGGVWGLVHLMGEPSGASADSKMAALTPGSNKGVMDLICELELDLNGQLKLGITDKEPSRITMAQIDFEKNSGWYQGKIAISESRSGTLQVMGTRLKVTRPAMFQRFGVMISGEEFVIDRKTGRFVQTLTLSDGQVVTLITGTCAQVTKPPF